MKTKKILLILIILFLSFLYSNDTSEPSEDEQYEIFGEQIVILENSGTNYISFVTIRTPFENTAWLLDKSIKLEDFLDNFLYLNPIDYVWDEKSSPLYNFFTFSKGSYGTIIKGNFKPGVSIKKNETFSINDGIHNYKNEDGIKELNGNYGLSYEQYGFTQLTYAWIIPQDWEFVKYTVENTSENTSDSTGEWVSRNNTLIYVGKNVNNLVFNISYKRKKSDVISKIKKEIESSKVDEIEIKEVDNGLQIIFSEKILFAPGKANLSPLGKKVLDKVAGLMRENPNFNLEVHGHTDNIKFKNPTDKISNNWELSVFRSLSIVNYLSKGKSLPGKRFEVRGYGEYRPVAPNDNPKGRAKNRRIELFLVDNK